MGGGGVRRLGVSCRYVLIDTLNLIIDCVDSIVNLVFYKLKVYHTTGHWHVGRRSVFELLSKRSAWAGGGGMGCRIFYSESVKLKMSYPYNPYSFLEVCL